MDYLSSFLSNNRRAFVLLAVLALVNLFIFWLLFGFHVNNDTDSFVTAINFFRNAPGGEMYPNRYLNPFYSVVAASVLRFLSPNMAIIVLNILFYFGMIFLSYDLIRRVFQNNRVALISATLFMTSYALLRYGLTQVEDIGGYFWFVLTLYAAWRWFEDKKTAWLFMGSVAISCGLLTKESGAMGALFFGALILLSGVSWGKKVLNIAAVASLAALTLFVNVLRGREVDYNSLRWLVDNWKVYGPTNFNFFKWLGVNLSTYNLLWLAIIITLYLLIRKKVTMTRSALYYFLAILVPSMSYLAWPVFISRTVFISAWLFVPLGALAIDYFLENRTWLAYMSWILILITPYFLQEILRYAHVFQIMDICQKNLKCSWGYFWENRDSFSKEL